MKYFILALLLTGCASHQPKTEEVPYCIAHLAHYASYDDCMIEHPQQKTQNESPSLAKKGLLALGLILGGAGSGAMHSQDNTVHCFTTGGYGSYSTNCQ